MPDRSASPGSSRSSATPPPQVTKKKIKDSMKPNTKGKKKKEASPSQPKNEGADPNWAYTPPKGAVLIDCKDEEAGEFDWDAVNNDDDAELWLIRVPEAIKPKHLENLTIDIPSSARSSCVGTLKRKYMTYDLWSVGQDDGNPFLPVGGEEIKSISCLLPRKKKKGKLYPAPKPFSHHLVLTAQPVKPTPADADTSTTLQKNPQRPTYPKERLKHRFMPYGSLAMSQPNDASMQMVVDKEEVAVPQISKAETSQPTSASKNEEVKKAKVKPAKVVEVVIEAKKSKKRKGDPVDVTDTPVSKKAKKAKVVP